MEYLENWKEVLGALFCVLIGVVWIGFALLGTSNMVILFFVIALTMVFGTLSGGLYAMSYQEKKREKSKSDLIE
jgi:hypothetical protein